MGQDVNDKSRVCRGPPGPRKDLNWHLRPRTRIMAVGLTFILTTSLMYYLMLPPSTPPVLPLPTPLQLIPHGAIQIDGDANFTATALQEGWPGDGSPENPFIIDGLDIDLGDEFGNCISIFNTRVSFTISNCNLTGAGAPGPMSTGLFGAGIRIVNATNGELVNNTCHHNSNGIILEGSDFNTVANNICFNNNPPWFGSGISVDVSANNTVVNNNCSSNVVGISLGSSSYNTVGNNTCNNNPIGIYLEYSDYNTVVNNTCNSNDKGIIIEESDSNTVVNNTCNNNRIGIYLLNSFWGTVVNNTCMGNTEHDILVESETESETEEFDSVGFVVVGFAGIIVLGAGQRLVTGIRKFN